MNIQELAKIIKKDLKKLGVISSVRTGNRYGSIQVTIKDKISEITNRELIDKLNKYESNDCVDYVLVYF